MLTRPARAVFDLGRHVERADGTGRLLSLHLALVGAVDPERRDGLVDHLLALTGNADDGSHLPHPPHSSLLDRLGYDEARSGSVLAAWAAARTNAHDAREVLPAQVVEVLEATRAAVPPGRWRGKDPSVFLTWVRERTAVVVGSADASCPRDEAWWFLRLGSSLERAASSSLLLVAAAMHEPLATSVWSTALEAAGAPPASTDRCSPADAAATLLLDRAWPRSVVAALTAAEEALDGLEGEGVRRDALDVPRQRLVRTRTALEYQPVETTLGDLAGLSRQVRRSASAVARGIEDACLRPASPASWLVHAG